MEIDREELLRGVANALTSNPGAPTGEIAAAANVSRATLHRVLGGREELVEATYGWMLEQCGRVFDRAGIDHEPVLEAFDRLIEDSYPLAQSLWLLIATPELERVPELLARLEAQDQRLERFFVRGQEEGLFRRDLPPRWLTYSLGSQVMSAWYMVDDGYAGARDVPRLVRAAVLEGVLADAAGSAAETPGSAGAPRPKES
ncbi:MAG: TetR/AcrR family transcriptional regulator [Solirubrobacterales bacterium]|nr:TetR/AcrR family transcriptional regulator [Solirubrobacterales bacterium]